VNVSDFVRAGFAHHEGLSVGAIATTALSGAKQTLLFHKTAECRVARHHPQTGVFTREREEIVVMQLKAPSRMVAMLFGYRLNERGRDFGMGARVRRHLAREGGQRVWSVPSGVPPTLNRFEREADGIAIGWVAPGSRR
jgi:hypothetical protein